MGDASLECGNLLPLCYSANSTWTIPRSPRTKSVTGYRTPRRLMIARIRLVFIFVVESTINLG